MGMSKPQGKGMMELTEEEKELLLLSGFTDLPLKQRLGDESSGSGHMSPGNSTYIGKRKTR